MRKFILKTISFLLFTAALYIVFLFIANRYLPAYFKHNLNYKLGSYGHLYSRLSEVENYGDVDILFLGSSLAYRSFDPRIFSEFGYRIFTLGSSSQTPVQTKVLLDRYLDTLNPEMVIYEVNPVTMTIDGVESALDLISNDKNDINSLKMAFKINNLKVYNTLLYGVIRDIFRLNSDFYQPAVMDNDTYISGGYVEKDIRYYQPEERQKNRISWTDYQLEALSDIATLIHSKNIELILIFLPNTKVTYDSYVNIDCFDKMMETYSTYYNLNGVIELNDSYHFYDAHHLNQHGVEKLNRELIELLAKWRNERHSKPKQ